MTDPRGGPACLLASTLPFLLTAAAITSVFPALLLLLLLMLLILLLLKGDEIKNLHSLLTSCFINKKLNEVSKYMYTHVKTSDYLLITHYILN